jgi:hypothetical protein
MKLIDLLFTSKVQKHCGVFGCRNTFYVDATKVLPEILACPSCEKRINCGILQDVHAHTSKLSGAYNVFDERYLR